VIAIENDHSTYVKFRDFLNENPNFDDHGLIYTDKQYNLFSIYTSIGNACPSLIHFNDNDNDHSMKYFDQSLDLFLFCQPVLSIPSRLLTTTTMKRLKNDYLMYYSFDLSIDLIGPGPHDCNDVIPFLSLIMVPKSRYHRNMDLIVKQYQLIPLPSYESFVPVSKPLFVVIAPVFLFTLN
jgi:hypothetical protein